MRYAINIPNFGSVRDPRTLVELARRTEDAGWDGFFLGDHVLVDSGWNTVIADPWVALAAIAGATERILIGPMAPLRRAARWDGFYPASDEAFVPLEVFARDVARVRELRAAAGIGPEVPFAVSAGGSTTSDDPAAAAATVAGFAEAGATWWQEIVSDWLGGLDHIRARIDAGPPRG